MMLLRKPKSKDDENESEEETDRLIEQEMRRKEVQFDSKKYFGSMVTHETIQLYCYVLHQYKTNTAKVNHYVYAYFFRVQQFHAIEDGTMEPMLFNIHVLLVFNKMLQDTATTGRSQTFRPFVEFIRTIIRNFFALADTNHLVFVESLIRHSYAPRTCAQIQNKYKSMAMGSKDAVSVGQDDNNDNKELRKYLPGNFDLDGEAEFDGGVASFGVVAPASSSADVALAGASAPSTKSSKNAVRKKRDNTKMWSKVEDRYLGKMYHKYRHLPSVFEVISYEDMFQDRDRTPDQIERRVKHLKLHKLHEYDVSSDSDDKQADKPWDKGDDSSDDGGNTSGKPSVERGATTQGTPIERPVVRSRRRRRLVRHAASNDKDESNSDDDLAMLTGASSSKAANVPANEKQKTDGGEEGDADVPSGTTLSPFLKQKSTTRFIRTNHDSDDDDDDLDELMAASRRAQVLSEEGVPPDSPKRRRGSDDDVADDFSSSKRRRPHDESEPSTADVGSTTHDQPMDDEQSEVRGAIEQSEDYTFDQSIDMYDTHDNADDEGVELLQRARLLVQAASNLPDFSTLFSKRNPPEEYNGEASSGLPVDSSYPHHESGAKPPVVVAAPKKSKKKKPPVTDSNNNQHHHTFTSNADEATSKTAQHKQASLSSSQPEHPQHSGFTSKPDGGDDAATTMGKQQRKAKKKAPTKPCPEVVAEVDSAEKLAAQALARKYAQERAAARVASKLREKLAEKDREEQSHVACVHEFYETLDDKEQRLKGDRIRAKERLVKAKHAKELEKQMATNQPGGNNTPHAAPLSADQLEKFQRQTKERLVKYESFYYDYDHY
ncbi:hypothetical protein DYB38_000762 [Aphanomyces astaci]|uniref:Uncharacterized protein n=2 Tax=Aphanomyces astaci TaxID=112090 RepID=A0A397DZ02_APHAT|nr:hypothetical protein DYB38_000762 [Aphanomyces astaci]